MGSSYKDTIIEIISPIVFIVIWEIVARLNWIDVRFFPGPSSIMETFSKMISSGEIFSHLGISLTRIILGFALGAIPGLILGLAKNQGIDALCLLSEIDNPNIIQPKAAQLILSTLVQILKIKLLDMSELEEEEKRKNFMQQQINYFEKATQDPKSPGIA